MAFDAYPELTVPAGAAVATSFTELRSSNTPPRQYIFVASTETGVAPDLQLQAEDGDPVSMIPTTSAIFSEPNGTGAYVADALLGFDWSGAILVQAYLYLPGPSRWTLTVVNRDRFTRHFTFIVSDTDQNPLLAGFDAARPLSSLSGKPGDTITVFGDHFDQPGLEVAFANSNVGPSIALARARSPSAAGADAFWHPGQIVNFSAQRITVKVPAVQGSVLSVNTCWGRALCPEPFFIKI